jgi:transcriptional regulator with XRE-family HTH domain
MLSENIKEFRIEKGLSQAELAQKVGVSQGAIYFWEKGINEPTAGCIIKLAKVFSVTADELLSYQSDKADNLSERERKINKCFSALNESQQDILINVAEEFLKK